MKFFAYILSFYILILTAIPCMDEHEDNTLQKTEISPKTTHDHQQDIDHCSPFCTCNCCASPVLQFNVVIEFICFKYSVYDFPEYNTTITSSFFASIWQPPQFS